MVGVVSGKWLSKSLMSRLEVCIVCIVICVVGVPALNSKSFLFTTSGIVEYHDDHCVMFCHTRQLPLQLQKRHMVPVFILGISSKIFSSNIGLTMSNIGGYEGCHGAFPS